MKIESVQKMQNNSYMINNSVVLKNLNYDDEGISYTVDYDENLITEEKACELVQVFIDEALSEENG